MPAETSTSAVSLSIIWNDERGQDLIEYALMAGFMAVAVGLVMPEAAGKMKTIYDKLHTTLGYIGCVTSCIT